jgi:hypothetical protein
MSCAQGLPAFLLWSSMQDQFEFEFELRRGARRLASTYCLEMQERRRARERSKYRPKKA